MDKKQIDYAKLNQERIITIADLIREIIRKLWIVVAAAVIFAAIFGGYKYAKDSKAASASSESTVDMKVKLNDDAQTEVDNVLKIQDNLDEQQAYVDNSVLMQIDPYNESVVTLQYHYNPDNKDYSSDLLNSYMSYVNNGGLSSDLAAAGIDLDVQYISELLNCESNFETTGTSSDNNITLNSKSESFEISIIHENKADCEKMAETVISCMDAYQQQLQSRVGSHSLTLVDQSYSKEVDKEILTYKTDRVNSIISMQERIKDLTEKMTADQNAVIDKYNKDAKSDTKVASKDDSSAVPEAKNSDTHVSISKKYVVVGAAAGIILSCLAIIILYVVRGTVNKAEDIRSLYNLRVVGELEGKKKKGTALSGKGSGLTPEQQKELLSANLKVACKKEGIEKLLISGSSIAEVENGVKEYLTAELKKAGIEVCITDSFLTSGKALEKLAEYDHVLLIEQIGSTRYEDLSAELRICLEQQAEVLGTIVLN